MFPLPLFHTIPDDLESMDSRLAIRYVNTFMKNVLIRATNTVFQTASRIDYNQPTFKPFMEYCLVFCDMLSLHLQGDKAFFTSPCAQGKSLVVFLGPACNPLSDSHMLGMLQCFQQKLKLYQKMPEKYCPKDLVSSLEPLADAMHLVMQKQVDTMKSEELKKVLQDDELHNMILENMAWLMANSDISVLLPFVFAHHDSASSKFWPAVTAEGLNAMPELVKEHASYWQFAPFDPVEEAKRRRALF